MPAAAVIPAPEAYANVAAVKRLAVECHCGSGEVSRRYKLAYLASSHGDV